MQDINAQDAHDAHHVQNLYSVAKFINNNL